MDRFAYHIATIAVLPPPRAPGAPELRFSRNPTVGGTTITGTVNLIGAAVGPSVVQLSSSIPSIASVPATITVTSVLTEAGTVGTANFPITTATTATLVCPVITATHGGASTGLLLEVVSISG